MLIISGIRIPDASQFPSFSKAIFDMPQEKSFDLTHITMNTGDSVQVANFTLEPSVRDVMLSRGLHHLDGVAREVPTFDDKFFVRATGERTSGEFSVLLNTPDGKVPVFRSVYCFDDEQTRDLWGNALLHYRKAISDQYSLPVGTSVLKQPSKAPWLATTLYLPMALLMGDKEKNIGWMASFQQCMAWLLHFHGQPSGNQAKDV